MLYVKDDHVVYENNLSYFVNFKRKPLISSVSLPRGKVEIVFEYINPSGLSAQRGGKESNGRGRLFINGVNAGETSIEHGGSLGSESATFSIGRTSVSSVSPVLTPPSRFTGKIEKVTVTLR